MLWNKRDLKTYKSQIEQLATQLPEAFNDDLQQASLWYATLTADINKFMESICNEKPKKNPEKLEEWDTLIGNIAMQARRRTKVFYGRLKSAFAIPRGQPSYPVPARKVRRILQEPPAWSSQHAFRHTQRQERQPDQHSKLHMPRGVEQRYPQATIWNLAA